jgi:hypothetical protein
MSLRPGLLWLTLNLAIIIQRLSRFFFLSPNFTCPAYPRLNTTDLCDVLHVQACLTEVSSYDSVRGDVISTAQRSSGSEPGTPARNGGNLRRERCVGATGHSVTK